MTTLAHRTIRLGLVLVLVALGAFWALASPAAQAADDIVKITVKITDAGFEPSTVEVNQGQSVELTFLWAQTTHLDDEHIMVLDGYKLESEKVDKAHTSATLKFIATKSGTFNFACDIQCDIHDALQHGTLKVNAGGGAGGATLTPSKIQIDPLANVTVKGDHITLLATLQDKDGKPIPKAELTFLVEQQFAGQTGLMEVGTAKTGPAGIAELVYRPTRNDAEKMVVRFEGLGVYDASETTLNLPGSKAFVNVAPSEDDTLHGLKGWAPWGLLTAIGGVWATLLFIVYQAWKLSRAPRGGSA